MTLVREGQFKGDAGWRCHERDILRNEKYDIPVQHTDGDVHLLSGGAVYIRWDRVEPGPVVEPGAAVQPRSEFDHHRFRRTLGNETLEDFKNQQCSAKEKRAPEIACKTTIFPTVYVPSEQGFWVLNLSKDRYAEYLKAIGNDDTDDSEEDIMKTFGARWIENTPEDPELKALDAKAEAHGSTDDGH